MVALIAYVIVHAVAFVSPVPHAAAYMPLASPSEYMVAVLLYVVQALFDGSVLEV